MAKHPAKAGPSPEGETEEQLYQGLCTALCSGFRAYLAVCQNMLAPRFTAEQMAQKFTNNNVRMYIPMFPYTVANLYGLSKKEQILALESCVMLNVYHLDEDEVTQAIVDNALLATEALKASTPHQKGLRDVGQMAAAAARAWSKGTTTSADIEKFVSLVVYHV
jgi:hypothetical protein